MPPIKRPDLRYKRTSIPNCLHDKGSLFWGECRNWPYSRPLNKNDMLDEPIISNETADVVETVTSEEPGIYDDVRDPDDLIELETEPTTVRLKYYPFDGLDGTAAVNRYDFAKGFFNNDDNSNPADLFNGSGYLTLDTDDQYAIANASEIPVIPVAADKAESEMMPEPENLPVVVVVDTDVPDDIPAIAIIDPDDTEQPALIVPAEDVVMEQNSGGAIRAYGYRTGTGETIYGGAKIGAFFKKLVNKVANTGKNVAKKGLNIVKNVGKNVGKELLNTAVQTVVPAVMGVVSGGTEEDATGQGLYGGAIIAKGLYGGMFSTGHGKYDKPADTNHGGITNFSSPSSASSNIRIPHIPPPGYEAPLGPEAPPPPNVPPPPVPDQMVRFGRRPSSMYGQHSLSTPTSSKIWGMTRDIISSIGSELYKAVGAVAGLVGTAATMFGILNSRGVPIPNANITALAPRVTGMYNNSYLANVTDFNPFAATNYTLPSLSDDIYSAPVYSQPSNYSDMIANSDMSSFYNREKSFITPDVKEILRSEGYPDNPAFYQVSFKVRHPDDLVVFPPDEGKENPRMLTKLELDQIYTMIVKEKEYLLPFWNEPGVAPVLKRNARNSLVRQKLKHY